MGLGLSTHNGTLTISTNSYDMGATHTYRYIIVNDIEQADMDADRKSERLGELNRELDLVRRGLCILKN